MDNIVKILMFGIMTGCMAQVQLPVKPVNQAALVGNQVTLNCKSSSTSLPAIRWSECITQSVEENCFIISSGTSMLYIDNGGDATRAARYSVETPDGQYNLVVSGALSEDGGTYQCAAVASTSTMHYSEVILLDSEPYCSTPGTTNNKAVQGESVTWTCEVTYHGGWGPVMEWTKNGVDYDVTPQIAGTTITYSTTIEVQPTDDQTQFSVLTKFEPPSNPGEDMATNAPSYTHDFSFPALTVYYAPFGITTSPDQESFSPGDTVTCYAEANPAAAYEWTNMNNSQVVSNVATLEITEDMLGQARFRCIASNIHGTDMTDISIDVYTTTTTTTTTTTPAPTTTVVATTPVIPTSPGPSDPKPKGLTAAAIGGICAGVVILVIIVIIVIIFCVRKGKKEKEANASRPPKLHNDVIRSPEVQNNDKYPVYPDDKAGHATGDMNPYSNAGPYDVEVPPYDDVDASKRQNVEGLTYADLALEDVPRSRKPIQMVDATEYAEIRRGDDGVLQASLTRTGALPNPQPFSDTRPVANPRIRPNRSNSKNSQSNEMSLPRSDSSGSSPQLTNKPLLPPVFPSSPARHNTSRDAYNVGYESMDRNGSQPYSHQGSLQYSDPHSVNRSDQYNPYLLAGHAPVFDGNIAASSGIARTPSGSLQRPYVAPKPSGMSRNKGPYSPTISPNAISELQHRLGGLGKNNMSEV